MLRITVTTGRVRTTVGLEGRLAGPWADELAECWKGLQAEQSRGPIRIDLHGVTFIDAAGKALLRAMYEQGAELTATGCMTRAIADEITGRTGAASQTCVARKEMDG